MNLKRKNKKKLLVSMGLNAKTYIELIFELDLNELLIDFYLSKRKTHTYRKL